MNLLFSLFFLVFFFLGLGGSLRGFQVFRVIAAAILSDSSDSAEVAAVNGGRRRRRYLRFVFFSVDFPSLSLSLSLFSLYFIGFIARFDVARPPWVEAGGGQRWQENDPKNTKKTSLKKKKENPIDAPSIRLNNGKIKISMEVFFVFSRPRMKDGRIIGWFDSYILIIGLFLWVCSRRICFESRAAFLSVTSLFHPISWKCHLEMRFMLCSEQSFFFEKINLTVIPWSAFYFWVEFRIFIRFSKLSLLRISLLL